MELNPDKLLREMRKYQKQLAQHEREKDKLHLKQWRGMGYSDANMAKQLKSMDIDPKVFLKEAATLGKKIQGTHRVLMNFPRPPFIPGDGVFQIPPDPNVFDIAPPAVDGFGGGQFSDADCGFNLALGETNFQVSYQGSGWGWDGGPSGLLHYSTLVFSFVPPRSGNIEVNPYIDFKGSYAISAHDHWYSSTEATFRLKATSRLFQHYWEYGPSVTLIRDIFTDSEESGWVTSIVNPSYTTSVSSNDLVLIYVEIEMLAGARSSMARVDVDFKTGAFRRVKVPLIRIRYL